MSSPESNVLYHTEKRKAQHAMLHPRSNYEGQSRFVDPYANFQMPLHFDQYNPATWPSTNEPAHASGINMYCQQPLNPNQTYGDTHELDRAQHGGREVIPSINDRGNKSSTSSSVRHRPPVSQPHPAEPLQHDFDRRIPRDTGSKLSLSQQSSYMSPAAQPYSVASQNVTGPHSNGGHGNTSKPRVPHPQDAVKSIQRDGGRYTRETAPTALLPSPTPTNYMVVPQEAFYMVVPQGAFFRPPPSVLLPSIEFTPKGWHVSGVNLPCRLSAEHDIENPHDKVFIPSQGMREIIIKIQWPGYPVHPFEIQIGTKKGNISRGELLDLVCRVVIKFSAMLKERKAHVLAGNRKWAIGKTGLDVDRFFIARLVHRGCNYFQPEIWVPRPHEK